MKAYFNLVVLFFSACFLSACSVFDFSKHVAYQDKAGEVSVELLRKIKIGKTDRDWMVIQFGAPGNEVNISETHDLLSWKLEETRERSASIFPLVRYSSAKTKTRFLHVVLEKDRVKKRWMDENEHIDLGKIKSGLTPKKSFFEKLKDLDFFGRNDGDSEKKEKISQL